MKLDVQYAWNGDVAVAYQVLGEGPHDLLVVMGYLSNLEYAWQLRKLAAFYERLASFSRLIIMDRRGTGLSDRFGTGEAPPLETTNDDILAVLDAAGSVRTTVFGVWDGSYPAIAFAATHAERVHSLILYAAATKGMDEDSDWGAEAWQTFLDGVRAGWGTRSWTIKQMRWQNPSMLDDPDEVDRFVTWTRLSASPSSAVAMLAVERDTDVTDILPVIGVRTLVLHRTGDRANDIDEGRQVADGIPDARFVELAGIDSSPWVGDSAALLDEVEAFVTQRTERVPTDRVLTSVLFTDIVGSTELAAQLGDAAWKERLTAHDSIAHEAVERFHGRYVNPTGDGMLATFDGPARAVRCAEAIADGVRAFDLRVRAGVHTGEVELRGDDVGGIAVHIGARVAALAGADEILASSTVRDLTAGSGLVFEDAGEHELKGVPDRWRLFRVVV